jgi:hypothetical protein
MFKLVLRVYDFDNAQRVRLRYYPDREGKGYSIDTLSLAFALGTFRVKAPGTPPACANEKPKPTRLDRAKQEVTEAARRAGRHAPEFFALCVHDLIAAAKAEAIAEREAAEPKPYGAAIGTAGASYCPDATCFVGFERDLVRMIFSITVPKDHPIATTPSDRVNYRVTATSKVER